MLLLSSLHGSKHKKDSTSPKLGPSTTTVLTPPPCRLQVRIESPPLVMYGSRSESTGALLSGMFDLEVLQDDPFSMKSVELAVYQRFKAKKTPQHHHLHLSCKDCTEKVTELAKWEVLAHPASLPKRLHAYPFSHLLPGSLPATVDTSTFSIEYFIKAVATPECPSEQPFVISYPLKVSRSIIRAQDRTSVRVFPPTDLVATLILPNAIHQNSSFPIELLLEGVAESSGNKYSKWKMRKINWRIDEVLKLRIAQCTKHAPPLGEDGLPVQDKGKYAVIEHTKTLSSGELKSGWKTDFSGNGKIQLVDYQISTYPLSQGCCNMDDPTLGLTVNHILVMELVIAEEAVAQKSSRQAIPTGAARVLRMQFNLVVTERSGLGIAWDDEVPPVYADVPLSPPDYDKVAQLPKFEQVPSSLSFVDGINARLSLLSEGPRPTDGSSVDSPRLLSSS